MKDLKNWPKLEKLLEEKTLSYIDYSFAKHFLKEGSEAHAAFCALLLFAARSGHYCLQIKENKIFPQAPWLLEAPKFEEEIIQSLDTFPKDLFCLEGDLSKPFIRKGPFFYLQRNYLEESELWQELQRLLAKKPSLALDEAAFLEDLSLLESKELISQEQALAISKICKSCFTLLLGGPGTGKTYTAARFLELFSKYLEKKEQPLHIVLASPTGKAASHLRSVLQDIQGNVSLEVKTLHALLKRSFYAKKAREEPPLLADICIVDESSMIDLSLMKDLFKAIKSGSRLILLGDQEQLSPVESGSLLRDLRKLLPQHCSVLSQCLRTDSKTILDLSKSILSGGKKCFTKALEKMPEIWLPLEERASEETLFSTLDHFPLYQNFCNQDALKAMDAFDKYRILSPLREGFWGVERINQLFYQNFRKRKALVYPIMITRNDYRLELYNGQTGLLICQEEGSYALFKGQGLSFYDPTLGLRRFDQNLLPHFEYAYCLSIHKSQGSEFDKISILLPKACENFDRQLLYTALTRARKHLKIAAKEETLYKLLKEPPPCISGLLHRNC